jgi:hypothetical protein
LLLHVGQAFQGDCALGFAGSQQGQKIQTVFMGGTGKPGKIVVAYVGGVAVLALMAVPCVIHRDGRRDFKPSPEQFIFLQLETRLLSCQQRIDLTDRNVDAPFQQHLP